MIDYLIYSLSLPLFHGHYWDQAPWPGFAQGVITSLPRCRPIFMDQRHLDGNAYCGS